MRTTVTRGPSSSRLVGATRPRSKSARALNLTDISGMVARTRGPHGIEELQTRRADVERTFAALSQDRTVSCKLNVAWHRDSELNTPSSTSGVRKLRLIGTATQLENRGRPKTSPDRQVRQRKTERGHVNFERSIADLSRVSCSDDGGLTPSTPYISVRENQNGTMSFTLNPDTPNLPRLL